jgi:hypothetical protein
MSQVGRARGQLLDGGDMEDFQVDGPVAVDYPVSQPDRLLPGHAGEPVLDLSGKLPGSPASIISVSRRMSRCIDTPGLGQD